MTKIIKPDIVMKHRESGKKVIVDTKWKMPDDDVPADADLKQMFAYNEYWKSEIAVLLYPSAAFEKSVSYVNGMFIGTKARPERHICGIARVSVLDKSGNLLNKNIGRTIIKQIEAFEINSSLQPQY